MGGLADGTGIQDFRRVFRRQIQRDAGAVRLPAGLQLRRIPDAAKKKSDYDAFAAGIEQIDAEPGKPVNKKILIAELLLAGLLRELDNLYLLRPIAAEGCSVSLTELDTVYSFSGLVELHLLLDAKIAQGRLEEAKMKQEKATPETPNPAHPHY